MAWYENRCPHCRQGRVIPVVIDDRGVRHCRCGYVEEQTTGQLVPAMARLLQVRGIIREAQKALVARNEPSPCYYPEYFKVLQSYEAYYLRNVVDWLLGQPVTSVLDVCSGAGTFLEIASALGIPAVAGLDQRPWPGQIERYDMHVLNLLDLESLDRNVWRPAQLVTCMEGLEHIPYDTRPAMQLLCDRVDAQWLFLCAPTPVWGGMALTHFRDLPVWAGEDVEDRHHKAWTLAELADYCLDLGFVVQGTAEHRIEAVHGPTDFIRAVVLAERAR